MNDLVANVRIRVCARGSGMFDFIEANLRVRYEPMKVHAQSLRNRLAGEILKVPCRVQRIGKENTNKKNRDYGRQD
jgi:hypothetical protein